MQSRIFYAVCFGFATGVFLSSIFPISLYFGVLFGFIFFFCTIFFIFISKNRWGIIGSIFTLALCLGIVRFSMAEASAPRLPSSAEISILGGSKVSLSGEVINEPDMGQSSQKFILETEVNKYKINILVNADTDEVLKYGDYIKVVGALEKPENFITEQGKEFDYINYLKKDGIFYTMGYPKVEIISRGKGNPVKNALFYAKEKFLEKLNLAIRSPESLLMQGLILGEKSSFDESLRQNFINTGTIHIVALSGYNVTIVAEWIMKMLSFLPYQAGASAGIIVILLFVLMTGMSSTAIRAGIMASIALFSRIAGRGYDVGRALALAGVIMIAVNPSVLYFDVSFELSFIATIAVIYLAPKMEKYFLWIPNRFELRSIISVTFAAYIFVLPFILYEMGNLSLVALPTNAVILPFIPFTMILGFVTGFAGIFSHVLSVPLGFISYLFLHYELSMINFLASIPFSSISVKSFPLVFVLLIYAYFIYKIFGRSIKSFFSEK